MSEVSAQITRVRRHVWLLVDAIEHWQHGLPTLDALGRLVRDVKTLLSVLEADADTVWMEQLGEHWGELEMIYAVRLDVGGNLTDEGRRRVNGFALSSETSRSL